jgi:DNA segregation ATPase FtsK/SpoIIIE, S-DNA-T family
MENVAQFNQILSSFNIRADCLSASQTGNYIFFDLRLHPNVKVKEIQKYSDELSLALHAPCKPSFKILHEQGIVRMEFATPRTNTLKLFDYFSNDDVPAGDLVCLLGQTVDNKKVWMNLLQNPHMLVAGTTGSGKSTLLHNIIANVFNYNDADLFLIDPKRIEFSLYENIRDTKVYYTYDDTIKFLSNMIEIMEERYNNIRAGSDAQTLKPIVIIIDEFADLIMQDKDDVFFTKLCRLAQKCRAARMSIILSTQRPSVNIINGSIKANFPARIACKVASHVDSKVVLDTSGAENLLGKGDALLRDNTHNMERFQVAYTDAVEVCKYFGK